MARHSRGMKSRLQIPGDTIDYIARMGKQCYTGQTVNMVDLYNTLANEGTKVGGLFHSTC